MPRVPDSSCRTDSRVSRTPLGPAGLPATGTVRPRRSSGGCVRKCGRSGRTVRRRVTGDAGPAGSRVRVPDGRRRAAGPGHCHATPRRTRPLRIPPRRLRRRTRALRAVAGRRPSCRAPTSRWRSTSNSSAPWPEWKTRLPTTPGQAQAVAGADESATQAATRVRQRVRAAALDRRPSHAASGKPPTRLAPGRGRVAPSSTEAFPDPPVRP